MARLQIIVEELPGDKISHATDIGNDEALTLPDPDRVVTMEKFEVRVMRHPAQVLMDQEVKSAALARLHNRLRDPEVEDINNSTGRVVSYSDYRVDINSPWSDSMERQWFHKARMESLVYPVDTTWCES